MGRAASDGELEWSGEDPLESRHQGAGDREDGHRRGHQLHLAADNGVADVLRSTDPEDVRVVGRDVGEAVDPADVDDYSMEHLTLPDDVPHDVVFECRAEFLPTLTTSKIAA